jgi:hypothetical protein
MNRRAFLRRAGLATAATAATAGSAGCLGFQLQSGGISEPPIVENRPDGVYVPSHVEGMQMVGQNTGGDYKVALTYSYAHRFWNVTGTDVERTDIEEGDDVHLMAVVWDPETGQVLPETGLSVEIMQGDSLVSQEVIYPMLSQPMGFHYGANFGLAGDGDYTATLSVGAVQTRRTGSFQSKFDEPADIPIEFSYSQSDKETISFERLEDRAGTRDALDPMAMEMLPDSAAPEKSALPGTVVGEGTSGDAVLLTTVLDSPPAGIDADGQYLAVSARTPYNRMLLPAMGLQATVTRDGETVFDGELTRTLDPDLSYHYGATLSAVEDGDEVTLTPTVPPQTARHEGYETAFGGLKGEMESVSFTASR